jgi:hypothetical protein
MTCNEYFKQILDRKIEKSEICAKIVDLGNKPRAWQI